MFSSAFRRASQRSLSKVRRFSTTPEPPNDEPSQHVRRVGALVGGLSGGVLMAVDNFSSWESTLPSFAFGTGMGGIIGYALPTLTVLGVGTISGLLVLSRVGRRIDQAQNKRGRSSE